MKNSDAVDTIENGKYFAQIVTDDSSDSPRDWDNLGTMVCFHNRYNLGDLGKRGCVGKEDNFFWGIEDFNEWVKENKNNISVMLPLFLYDHSGISMSTGQEYPFNDMWDSGQVGWIFVTKEDVKKEFLCKIVSAKMKEKVTKILRQEVETYNDFLTGNVYGYQLYRLDLDEDMELEDSDDPEDFGEEIDSCYGYYGLDYLKSEVKEMIEWHMAKDIENCVAENI